MNFLSLTALFFLASCLASDSNSSNNSSNGNNGIRDDPMFLENFDDLKENHDVVVSFAHALLYQHELVRYDNGSAKVLVLTGKLTELITAEYNSSTDKINPFHEFFNVDALLSNLKRSKAEISLFQFRKLMSSCAINNMAMVSADIAIVNWLGEAFVKHIDIKIKPSLLYYICLLELHPNLSLKSTADICFLLSRVHRMIKANRFSKEELSQYAYVFTRLINVLESSQVIDKILKISDTILAKTKQQNI